MRAMHTGREERAWYLAFEHAPIKVARYAVLLVCDII